MLTNIPSRAILLLLFSLYFTSFSFAQNNTKLYAKISDSNLTMYAAFEPLGFIGTGYEGLRFDLDSINGLGFYNSPFMKLNDSIVPLRYPTIYHCILSNDSLANRFNIFVKPQDSIFIKVTDLEKVAFSGKGAYENQILYEFQKQFNFEDITNQLLYSPQKPKSYLDLKKQIDLIYEAQINFLKIANLKRQLDKNFEDWITLEINYFLQNNILTCHLENKIFDESILNKGLLISNLPQSLQLKSNQYNSFIIKYLEYLNMIETKKNNKNLDKHHKLIAARELLHNSAILNYIEVQLVLDLLKNYSNSRIIESEYQIVKQKIKDKILADYFEEIYQKSIATLVGKLCPNFTLNNNLGKVISSKDFNGKVIVLDFWASWCKPCIESLDKLKKIQNQYKNVSFVLISIDKNKQEWLKAIDKYELNEFTNLIAEENLGFKSPMAQKFGLKYIPTTFIIDKNQVIVANEISEASGEEWKIILNKTIELNK